MELTQAQRILFDTLNAKAKAIGEKVKTEKEFLEFFEENHPNRLFLEAMFEAMDTYARIKWQEACDDYFTIINHALGDLSIEDSLALVSAEHPEFKP